MTNDNTAVQNRAAPAAAEGTRGSQYFVPPVDIYETDEELRLCADLPGVKPEDVHLRFENGELILEGRLQPRQHTGKPLAREYEEGDFYRVFQVHESIDSTRIEAECKNGVLTVHLPKEERVKPRKVPVKTA